MAVAMKKEYDLVGYINYKFTIFHEQDMGVGYNTPVVHRLLDRVYHHKLVQGCCTCDIVAWYHDHKILNKMSSLTIHSKCHQSKEEGIMLVFY
jgi:hypothetical protein